MIVASFTDAWIETFVWIGNIIGMKSHLLQMRGLKPNLKDNNDLCPKSHLLQMRGLKHR